jgi:nucleotide-binding universal stress UspA family protein
VSRIVVGIDGSDASASALRWAVAEARLRHASVEAVHVLDATPTTQAAGAGIGIGTAGVAPVPPEVMDDVMRQSERDAGNLLLRMVAELGDVGDVAIEQVVLRQSGPARGLVKRSRGADLLVVGSRGLGGFRELLLGSVSHQCATHALCPVVILRQQRSPA